MTPALTVSVPRPRESGPRPAARAPVRIAVILGAVAGLSACASMEDGSDRRVTYACDRGQDLTVIYTKDAARIVGGDGQEIVLPQRPSGSGFWYETPQHSLRGKGNEVTYTVGRMVPMTCKTG